jgi:hypothetical protein
MLLKRAISDYDASIKSRAQRYRERARVLRSAGAIVSAAQCVQLLERAEEYEDLAESIDGLCIGDD